MNSESISFLGAGNLAWHLAPAFDNAGYAVREVYSRKAEHASALAEKLYQCEVVTSPDFSESPSRIFIMAIADDAIPELLADLLLPPGAILVHTSGSQPLSVLGESTAATTGVFYPLQTFSKARRVDFEEVPVFIESDDETTTRILIAMARSISRKVVKITSSERMALHVAAVFASNFTNHMLTISREMMKQNNLNFELLKPLIAETLNKSLEIGPHKSQTGPARRGDLEILDRHMEFLGYDEQLATIYKNISQHIIDCY